MRRRLRRPCPCLLCACDKRTVKRLCDFCEVGLHRESPGGVMLTARALKAPAAPAAKIICPICGRSHISPTLAAAHADRHTRGEI
jgi:hypothetical protein